MSDKQARKNIIETHDDFRRLYTDAVRDNGMRKNLSFEEADHRARKAWASTSSVEFDRVALELSEIYNKFGYDTASRAAAVAARFENGKHFEVQMLILNNLEYAATKHNDLFEDLLAAVEAMVDKIDEKRSVSEDVTRTWLLEGENLVAIVFFCKNGYKYVAVGKISELKEVTEREVYEDPDPQLFNALNSIIKHLDKKTSEDAMMKAKSVISRELEQDSAEEIIKRLRGQERK